VLTTRAGTGVETDSEEVGSEVIGGVLEGSGVIEGAGWAVGEMWGGPWLWLEFKIM